jgi:CDP-paratose 2-epimerase
MRRNPVTIYGDGCQVRDILHISDAAAAWLAVLDDIDAVKGSIFNVGGGPENTVSLLEALDRISGIVGTRPQLSFADWRPGDQPWYVSDIRAIGAALGWAPRVSVAEGLLDLAAWLALRFEERPLGEGYEEATA